MTTYWSKAGSSRTVRDPPASARPGRVGGQGVGGRALDLDAGHLAAQALQQPAAPGRAGDAPPAGEVLAGDRARGGQEPAGHLGQGLLGVVVGPAVQPGVGAGEADLLALAGGEADKAQGGGRLEQGSPLPRSLSPSSGDPVGSATRAASSSRVSSRPSRAWATASFRCFSSSREAKARCHRPARRPCRAWPWPGRARPGGGGPPARPRPGPSRAWPPGPPCQASSGRRASDTWSAVTGPS